MIIYAYVCVSVCSQGLPVMCGAYTPLLLHAAYAWATRACSPGGGGKGGVHVGTKVLSAVSYCIQDSSL